VPRGVIGAKVGFTLSLRNRSAMMCAIVWPATLYHATCLYMLETLLVSFASNRLFCPAPRGVLVIAADAAVDSRSPGRISDGGFALVTKPNGMSRQPPALVIP